MMNVARPLVSLTLDDGRRSQYETAWPILQRRNMRATFYITSGFVDGRSSMRREQVVELHRVGNEIGAHTITHPDLTVLSAPELHRQLFLARMRISHWIDASVSTFAAPGGKYDDQVLRAIERNYESHRTVLEGVNRRGSLIPHELRAINIYSYVTRRHIEPWLEQTKAENGWLILTIHGVEPGPDTWSSTPETFEGILAAVQESGIEVATVGAAFAEFSRGAESEGVACAT
jgi:peptidoglycan/xylan/chitin deacetylase (PgdA/CDA1 family)